MDRRLFLEFLPGIAFRPPLLQRPLGYKLRITDRGWHVLHLAWVCIALMLAGANELAWRNFPTDPWVIYSSLSGPVAFAIYYLVTRRIAWAYWIEEET